jgi:hypothetical protein
MMLSCREATRLVSYSMEHRLPWTKRTRVRIHLVLCKYCARFEDQCLWLKTYSERYMAQSGKSHQGECLSSEARARIQQTLSR